MNKKLEIINVKTPIFGTKKKSQAMNDIKNWIAILKSKYDFPNICEVDTKDINELIVRYDEKRKQDFEKILEVITNYENKDGVCDICEYSDFDNCSKDRLKAKIKAIQEG